jgi:hypothetical protein
MPCGRERMVVTKPPTSQMATKRLTSRSRRRQAVVALAVAYARTLMLGVWRGPG